MPEVQLNFGTLRRYMPAVLNSNTNGWYIEYYAFNQITNGLERKRQRVNKERKRARTFAEIRSITTQMIIQINVGKRLVAVRHLINLTSAAYHAGCYAAYPAACTAGYAVVCACACSGSDSTAEACR